MGTGIKFLLLVEEVPTFIVCYTLCTVQGPSVRILDRKGLKFCQTIDAGTLYLSWKYHFHCRLFSVNVQHMLCRSCTPSCIIVWAVQSTAKLWEIDHGRLAKIAHRHHASDPEFESMCDELRPSLLPACEILLSCMIFLIQFSFCITLTQVQQVVVVLWIARTTAAWEVPELNSHCTQVLFVLKITMQLWALVCMHTYCSA